MICQKCWADAYELSRNSGIPTHSNYVKKIASHNCTAREQAGDYWDQEENKRHECRESSVEAFICLNSGYSIDSLVCIACPMHREKLRPVGV